MKHAKGKSGSKQAYWSAYFPITRGDVRPPDRLLAENSAHLAQAIADPFFPVWLPLSLAEPYLTPLVERMLPFLRAYPAGIGAPPPRRRLLRLLPPLLVHETRMPIPGDLVLRLLVAATYATNVGDHWSGTNEAMVPYFPGKQLDLPLNLYLGSRFADEWYPGYLSFLRTQKAPLQDLDLAVFTLILAFWGTVPAPNAPPFCWITADQILDYLGIARQSGRTHRTADRQMVAASFKRLDRFWLEITGRSYRVGRNHRTWQVAEESKLLIIRDFHATWASATTAYAYAWEVGPGVWGDLFLQTHRRPLLDFPVSLLAYLQRKMRWEKRLGYHLVTSEAHAAPVEHRSDLADTDAAAPAMTGHLYTVGQLLMAVGYLRRNLPKHVTRIAGYLHRALDQLQVDNIIGSWYYLETQDHRPPVDPALFFREWLQTPLIIWRTAPSSPGLH